MIQHIFKIIWTERKMNSWIVFELVLVFCILWFCVDYISFFMQRYFEPRGYTIEHVYTVNLGVKDASVLSNIESQEQQDSLINSVWTIIDRIKKYPDIEAVSISWAAIPYSGSYTNASVMIDSVEEFVQIKTVTPNFFKVFGMTVLQGNPTDWNNGNNVFISGNNTNLFAKKDVTHLKTFNLWSRENEYSKTSVIGLISPSKRSEFDSADPIIYKLMGKNDRELISIGGTEICFKVKAGADKNFISRFTKDMQEQLSVYPFYLSSLTSMSDLREDYMKQNGYDNNFKSIFAVSAFLFINIFLAVVGTFWFRIQTRRNEIGLRIALGSTRINIKTLFIVEALILLFLASIVATPVCVNIALADILKDIGVPSISKAENHITIGQYVINYCITFSILMLTAIIAVWYPAKKASEIQPAEALHYE